MKQTRKDVVARFHSVVSKLTLPCWIWGEAEERVEAAPMKFQGQLVTVVTRKEHLIGIWGR
jgi:hypothetical protein